MSLASDIRAAKAAVDKLNAYSAGVAAAGGKDATAKYLELNAAANRAIDKLPEGFMKTREGLAISAAFLRLRRK